ncbi:predicted protein [Histoplasma capsulatum H143]|uniref:Uncharacterized protein n=1 Tax=Ajellomyces capsulatus (strain H143) TaxID=544712 RepID=C6H8A1_AJECH|nr:predicted protein [Histoplasma capsulatum H143]
MPIYGVAAPHINVDDAFPESTPNSWQGTIHATRLLKRGSQKQWGIEDTYRGLFALRPCMFMDPNAVSAAVQASLGKRSSWQLDMATVMLLFDGITEEYWLQSYHHSDSRGYCNLLVFLNEHWNEGLHRESIMPLASWLLLENELLKMELWQPLLPQLAARTYVRLWMLSNTFVFLNSTEVIHILKTYILLLLSPAFGGSTNRKQRHGEEKERRNNRDPSSWRGEIFPNSRFSLAGAELDILTTRAWYGFQRQSISILKISLAQSQ